MFSVNEDFQTVQASASMFMILLVILIVRSVSQFIVNNIMIITIRYDLIETRKKYLENKKILDEEEKKKYEVQLVALKEK